MGNCTEKMIIINKSRKNQNKPIIEYTKKDKVDNNNGHDPEL